MTLPQVAAKASAPTSPGPPPPRDAASVTPARLAARMVLAGLLAAGLSAGLSFTHPLPMLSPGRTALVAVVVGWLVVLAFVPWRRLKAPRDHAADLRRLTEAIRQWQADQRDTPLSTLLIDGDDELGRLSRAVHDSLAHSISHRVRANVLHKTMDDSIRRETQRRTLDLEKQANTDPLTGLGNRRALEQRLAEFTRADDQRNRTMAVLVIDVDHFKQINDRLGHEAGDACLKFLGQLLRSSLRPEDAAHRNGGDEFVVLMPNQKTAAAKTAAERVSSLFSQMPWPHRGVPRPTLSVGVASARPSQVEHAEDLVRRADRVMYLAKRSGRGTVCIEQELLEAA